MNLQGIIQQLGRFWESQGCLLCESYDLETGAGTFNPATFIRSLGEEPFFAAYTEPCRRPADGRYGQNPNRLQRYFQYQVLMKPAPPNFKQLYLESLEYLGLKGSEHDIRFVHDDWQSPTLGAWGLGWEVWLNGMEISQFTYFQQVGGLDLSIIPGEITYGLERLALYLQNKNSVFDLSYNDTLSYGDVFLQTEEEFSKFNFDYASTEVCFTLFKIYEEEAKKLIEHELPLVAYDFVIKCSHIFNILESRSAISVTERTGYIGRIRKIASAVAKLYLAKRRHANFPLLARYQKQPILAKNRFLREQISGTPEISRASSADLEKGMKQESQKKTAQKKTAQKKTEDFLFEIGMEELPHESILVAENKMGELAKSLFQEYSLSYESLELFSTPRRLAFIVKDLILEKPREQLLKKGPLLKEIDIQAPRPKPGFFKALKGFLHSIAKNHPHDFKEFFHVGQKNNKTALPLADEEGLLKIVAGLKEISGLPAETIASGLYTKKIGEQVYLLWISWLPAIRCEPLLVKLLEKLMQKLVFPQMMYWGNGKGPFLRPLQYLTAILGKDVIPFHFAGLGLHASNTTLAHPFLSNGKPLHIAHARDWQRILREQKVIASYKERYEGLFADLTALEKKHEIRLIRKESLAKLNTNLCEYPTPLLAKFDSSYLELPKEVLESELIVHQKYFPALTLAASKGPAARLSNSFVLVSNIENQSNVIAGNLRVLKARFNDGKFFYEKDLKLGLEGMRLKLSTITFEKSLGSYQQKVERVACVATLLKQSLEAGAFIEVATLSPKALALTLRYLKADLASQMVFEFPELEGLMASYYAKAMHLDAEVARALHEHYLPDAAKEAGFAAPKGKGMLAEAAPKSKGMLAEAAEKPVNFPTSNLACFMAIADKLDTLLGLYAIGMRPTGSRDPYALRRQALSLCVLMIRKGWHVSLAELWEDGLKKTYASFIQKTSAEPKAKPAKNTSMKSEKNFMLMLFSFCNVRLKSYLLNLGFQAKEVSAVLYQRDFCPLRSYKALKAYRDFSSAHFESFKAIFLLYKRIHNMISAGYKTTDSTEEETEKNKYFLRKNYKFSARELDILNMKEERALLKCYGETELKLSMHLKRAELLEAMKLFTCYLKPSHDFFDEVMVNVKELETSMARRKLLKAISWQMEKVLQWNEVEI